MPQGSLMEAIPQLKFPIPNSRLHQADDKNKPVQVHMYLIPALKGVQGLF